MPTVRLEVEMVWWAQLLLPTPSSWIEPGKLVFWIWSMSLLSSRTDTNWFAYLGAGC